MSLARLASSCFSGEALSTTASRAELRISTIRIRMMLPISRARSTPLRPRYRASGMVTAASRISSRKAASFFQAAAMPSRE